MTDYSQLIKDCLKGSAIAQKQLYALFSETMLGVCYRYTKSLSDAEDVMQEGFIKVFLHLHQYKSEGELGGWIRRIMVTTSLNYLKKSSQYKYDLVFENSNIHPVAEDNPEMNMSAKEIAEMIRQLPTGYQTIFNLHAIEGYSHVEIGKMLGINEGTSRSQYSRARGLLINWMNKNKEELKSKLYAQ